MVLNTAEIGERIVILRKRQKLTQTELAHKLNKSLRTVQKYERGEIELSLTVINELAAILNSTVEYLIGCGGICVTTEFISDFFSYLHMIDQLLDGSLDGLISAELFSSDFQYLIKGYSQYNTRLKDSREHIIEEQYKNRNERSGKL